MKKSKLPKTDSVEELARFWDVHDVTDFEDELEEAQEPVFERRSGIHVQLEQREAKAVKKLAQAKGVSEAELVRGWVLQHLAQGNGRGARKRQPMSKTRKK